MIVSLTPDSVWQAQFAQLPPLPGIYTPLVVIAPHPDDETLGAGMLIASLRSRGIPVEVIAATDGENAYDIPLPARERLGAVRQDEQRRALGELDVPADCIHRLHLTDSGLHKQETKLTERIAALARPGCMLLAPWAHDFHPDHEACARAASAVAHARSLPLLSYFFWTWHRGTPSLLNDLPLCRFDGDAAQIAAKQAALRCHTSQLQRADEEPILPERLLGPSRWSFEVFLRHD